MKVTPPLVALLVAVVATAADPPAQKPVAALIDPYFPTIFVTFAGFGKATAAGEMRMAESGEPKRTLSVTPEPGDQVWLKLQNNTIWPIAIPTESMYLNGLKSGMQISLRYTVVDESGASSPSSAYDFFSISELPPGCTVFFPVPRETFKGGKVMRVRFGYSWEPKGQPFSGAAINHELTIDGDIVPPGTRL